MQLQKETNMENSTTNQKSQTELIDMHHNMVADDEMDPCFRVYYDDTQSLLNAQENIEYDLHG